MKFISEKLPQTRELKLGGGGFKFVRKNYKVTSYELICRALFNWRNFLHDLIPPFLGAFYNYEKNILFLKLNRLFLNNIKFESFVQCRKILNVIKHIRNGG